VYARDGFLDGVHLEMAPNTATVFPGATRQWQSVVVNSTNQAVTWSSTSDAIATVDARGLVTGRAAGAALILAVSQADSSARDVAAVRVMSMVDFPIVIRRITVANTNTPVPVYNVSGQIDVTAELNVPQSYPIQRVEFLLDNFVLPNCTQTLQGSPSLEGAVAARQIVCSINTAEVNASTDMLVFPNATYSLSARIVRLDGSLVSTRGYDLYFNNLHSFRGRS
jgi:hypothetical protein